jgi:hypothetical protein
MEPAVSELEESLELEVEPDVSLDEDDVESPDIILLTPPKDPIPPLDSVESLGLLTTSM